MLQRHNGSQGPASSHRAGALSRFEVLAATEGILYCYDQKSQCTAMQKNNVLLQLAWLERGKWITPDGEQLMSRKWHIDQQLHHTLCVAPKVAHSFHSGNAGGSRDRLSNGNKG